MQTLLVATRKGLFVVRGQATQWAVSAHHFAGDPVSQVLADQGANWTEITAPAFPTKPTQGPLA